jgi:hypothetical protein
MNFKTVLAVLLGFAGAAPLPFDGVVRPQKECVFDALAGLPPASASSQPAYNARAPSLYSAALLLRS